MLDTDNPLRRYEMFKNELKKKDYKRILDGYLRSEIFDKHLVTQTQPKNMLKFMDQVAGVRAVKYEELVTNDDINSPQGRVDAEIFKQTINEHLDAAFIRDISNYFGDSDIPTVVPPVVLPGVVEDEEQEGDF